MAKTSSIHGALLPSLDEKWTAVATTTLIAEEGAASLRNQDDVQTLFSYLQFSVPYLFDCTLNFEASPLPAPPCSHFALSRPGPIAGSLPKEEVPY